VTLTAPASIVDALADAAADVTGVNITLRALAGGIGSGDNFVETNLLELADGAPAIGVLRADAPQGIYVEETTGDLRVHHVYSQFADVTLVARAGSILDGNDDLDADGVAGTFTDADGTVRDAVNVMAVNIDLDANGGGSIGVDDDDLDIDSGVWGGESVDGRLYAEADADVFVTETNGALRVLAARALGGSLRLTVPDTSAADTENLCCCRRQTRSSKPPRRRRRARARSRLRHCTPGSVTTSRPRPTSESWPATASSSAETRGASATATTSIRRMDTGAHAMVARHDRLDPRAGRPDVAERDRQALHADLRHDDADTFTFEQTGLDATRALRQLEGVGGRCWRTTARTLRLYQLASMHVDRDGIRRHSDARLPERPDYYT